MNQFRYAQEQQTFGNLQKCTISLMQKCKNIIIYMSHLSSLIFFVLSLNGGWDSAVGITIRYGLGGPGIESRWGGRDFLHPSRPALGPTQPPIQWVPGLSLGVKQPRRGIEHPLPSGAEVEGRVELYIYSSSGPLRPVLGRTLPLPLPLPLNCICSLILCLF